MLLGTFEGVRVGRVGSTVGNIEGMVEGALEGKNVGS